MFGADFPGTKFEYKTLIRLRVKTENEEFIEQAKSRTTSKIRVY